LLFRYNLKLYDFVKLGFILHRHAAHKINIILRCHIMTMLPMVLHILMLFNLLVR